MVFPLATQLFVQKPGVFWLNMAILPKPRPINDAFETRGLVLKKTNLLLIITKQIINNSQGVIVDQELHSPFSYLFTLAALIKGYR